VDRFVVLGLGSVRSAWTREVTGWAMSGALAIDFVKCVSVEEMKARLRGGRTHSAVMCDAAVPGVDRDLFALAAEFEAAVIVVGEAERNWSDLGAAALLHEFFAREELLSTLELVARPVRRGEHIELVADEPEETRPFSAQLVAVTGRNGSGCSTVAISLAQAFGSSGRMGGLVVLADFAPEADLAMLHDATDIVPGLQELVDAHRTGRPSNTQIRSMTYAVPHRRYDLLLGLRRHRDWVALRPRAFDATIEGLRRSYRMVVADIAADFEGERECGSIDVEERNVAARATAQAADLVIAVGTASLSGIHGLVRTIDALVDLGVPSDRIQPVINMAPRTQRGRADLARTLSELVNAGDRNQLASPIHIAERRHLDDVHRNGTPMPEGICNTLLGAVEAGLRRQRGTDSSPHPGQKPERIVPGSLGSLSDDDAA
jgi:MinD-like ATPase involved in chromosome partitioning or flagellar assembly